ncbi:hypothetical protein J4456_01310 [Candidatus Pacearchaeota archaeon]|nr:hypothetical protein [Candidatus Pacearchaeota archaeon]
MLFYDNLEKYVTGQREKLAELHKANIPERGIILRVLASEENQTKSTNVANYSVTREVNQIQINHLGILGDRHHRAVRPSTGREKSLYPKGTFIREHRHVFVVSPYDCKILSDLLNFDVKPELLGANLVIGREDGQDYSISSLPQNTYLLIASNEAREFTKPPIATLKHYVLQQGCGITGNSIAERYGDKSLTQKFMASSKDNRGIVCSVEQPVDNPAIINSGQIIFFKFPMGIAP